VRSDRKSGRKSSRRSPGNNSREAAAPSDDIEGIRNRFLCGCRNRSCSYTRPNFVLFCIPSGYLMKPVLTPYNGRSRGGARRDPGFHRKRFGTTGAFRVPKLEPPGKYRVWALLTG
jgi:hypothetical protein